MKQSSQLLFILLFTGNYSITTTKSIYRKKTEKMYLNRHQRPTHKKQANQSESPLIR